MRASSSSRSPTGFVRHTGTPSALAGSASFRRAADVSSTIFGLPNCGSIRMRCATVNPSISGIWASSTTSSKGLPPSAAFCPYGKVKHYAFSRQPPSDPLPGVEFVSESIPEFVGKVQAMRGKNIWMMGGAGIIASFLDAGATR